MRTSFLEINYPVLCVLIGMVIILCVCMHVCLLAKFLEIKLRTLSTCSLNKLLVWIGVMAILTIKVKFVHTHDDHKIRIYHFICTILYNLMS